MPDGAVAHLGCHAVVKLLELALLWALLAHPLLMPIQQRASRLRPRRTRIRRLRPASLRFIPPTPTAARKGTWSLGTALDPTPVPTSPGPRTPTSTTRSSSWAPASLATRRLLGTDGIKTLRQATRRRSTPMPPTASWRHPVTVPASLVCRFRMLPEAMLGRNSLPPSPSRSQSPRRFSCSGREGSVCF